MLAPIDVETEQSLRQSHDEVFVHEVHEEAALCVKDIDAVQVAGLCDETPPPSATTTQSPTPPSHVLSNTGDVRTDGFVHDGDTRVFRIRRRRRVKRSIAALFLRLCRSCTFVTDRVNKIPTPPLDEASPKAHNACVKPTPIQNRLKKWRNAAQSTLNYGIVFLHSFDVHHPPSLLRCGDVAPNPGPSSWRKAQSRKKNRSQSPHAQGNIRGPYISLLWTQDQAKATMASLEHHHYVTPVIPRIVPPLYEDFENWSAWKEQQTRSLLARLKPAAAHEVVCVGDGNCFFRAVALQVFGTQDQHPKVRRDVVAYMRANSTSFIEWVPEIHFDEYCNKTACPYSDIVDQIPLFVVSVLYRSTLVVVDGTNGHGWYKVIPGPLGSSDHLFFVYRNENHYNACAPLPRIETTESAAVDISDAVRQLETRKRFVASLHEHVRSLVNAGYTTPDFEMLQYQSSSVRDGVLQMIDVDDSASLERKARLRQADSSARIRARDQLPDSDRESNRRANTSARIRARTLLTDSECESIRRADMSARIRARKSKRSTRCHPSPCLKMSLQEIVDDSDQPKPFTMIRCTQCECLRDASESKLCCSNGAKIISYDTFPDWPSEFVDVLNRIENLGPKSRELNNLCNFSSMGTSNAQKTRGFEYVQNVGVQRIPQIYHLRGRTFHRIPSVKRTYDNVMLFYDHHPQPSAFVNEDDYWTLREWMAENNYLATQLRTLSDITYGARDHRVENAGELEVLIHEEDRPKNMDEAYSLQGTTRNCFEPPELMGVVLPMDGDPMTSVPEWTQLYESAQYPLLFPLGSGGFYDEWSRGGRPSFCDRNGNETTTISSVSQFTKYVLYQKSEILSHIHTCVQQYILDQFSRWQSMAFQAMKKNADVLGSIRARTARYKEVMKTQNNKKRLDSRPFMLPASVPGSPAHQKREIRNGLSIFARKGNPHLFITFTGNQKWPEFVRAVMELRPGIQDHEITALNFPDVMARVFRKKLADLEKDLRCGKIFGTEMCYIQRVTEFQKRGMPHAHISLRLGAAKDDRSRKSIKITARLVDDWVTTRLFFHEECPLWISEYASMKDESQANLDHCFNRRECNCVAHELGRKVKKTMCHTKCDPVRCLREDGTCKRGYPKLAGVDESQRTWCDARGYWHSKRLYASDGYVVAYNRSLLLRYDAHINVEVSGTVKIICYLKKYMTKLPDCSRTSLKHVLRDPSRELMDWQKLRHTSVSEASLRLRDIDLNSSSIGCTQIFVHKPGDHSVRWWSKEDDQETPRRAASKSESFLLRYFWRHKKLRHLTFEQYYSLYVLQANQPRSNRAFYADTPLKNCDIMFAAERTTMHVARIEFCFTKDLELRALRSLLRIKPAFSFKNLRRVDGVLHPCFVDAAEACGLYTDREDAECVIEEMINPCIEEWKHARLNEKYKVPFAGEPHMLRRTFVMLLISGACALTLFEKYWQYLAVDMPFGENRTEEVSDDVRRHLLLTEISKLLFKERLSLEDVGLPEIEDELDIKAEEQKRYPQATLHHLASKYEVLNKSQQKVVKSIEHALMGTSTKRLFFLEGKPGRGKTFVTNVIAARQRLKGCVVAICSPSAKGAIQYMGALTAHKTFGAPVFDGEPDGPLHPLFSKTHRNARYLQVANLIIIDEAPMMHRCVFDMIDRFLRDIMDVDEPFGGKVILCSGDFGQLSPVTFLPGRQSSLAVSIKTHPSFELFKRLKLTFMWRSAHDRRFTNFTNRLADGNAQDGIFDIDVPNSIRMSSNEKKCLSRYFEDGLDLSLITESPESIMNTKLYKSAIIAYTNDDVNAYNDIVARHVFHKLQLSSEQSWVFSAFEHPSEGECNIATPEAMEALHEPGVPSHTLALFPFALTSLMRNFLPSRGLVNGALLLPISRTKNTIQVVNVTPGSSFFGERDTIFRFDFTMGVKQLMNFTRKQFPLRLAYAGTVHRFQGDTVHEQLLVDCRVPSFAHGQLSVAISRCTASHKLQLLVSPQDVRTRKLSGLVYREFISDDVIFERTHADMNVPVVSVFSTLDDDVSEDEERELQRSFHPKQPRRPVTDYVY